MLERSAMYVMFKGVAIAASILFMQNAGAKMEYLLILALAFSCILIAGYLLEGIGLKHRDNIQTAVNVMVFFVAFLIDMKNLFPVLIVLVFHVVDNYARGTYYFYYLLAGTMALVAIISNPAGEVLFFTLLLIIVLGYTKAIRDRVETTRELILEQKDELAQLNQKLSDNKRLAKTLQYTAALEERNRLAARLHDKVGHGISGSIILLEASMLMLDHNTEKAKAGIDKAVGNLREGVDDIRAALREERPVRSELGLNELHTMLEKFQVDHNIIAKLNQTGNTDFIGVDIWQCIHENLEESLTNILKHSNATEFRVSIQVLNKIIKVEYRDNGKTEGKFVKGLGLEAIEERTIKCGGRCFFEKTEKDFWITNVFTY